METMSNKRRWIQIALLLLISIPFIVVSLTIILPEPVQIFIGVYGLCLVVIAFMRFLDIMIDMDMEK